VSPQLERASRLHLICLFMDKRIQRGSSVRKAALRFVKKWNGRPYKTDPARHFALSYNSVLRAYGRWKIVRTRAAVLPRYRPRPAKIPEGFVTAFLEAACKSETFLDAWRQLAARKKKLPCSPRSLIRRLGPRFEPVRALFRVRVKTRRVEKKLLNRIETTLMPPKIAQERLEGVNLPGARSDQSSRGFRRSSRASGAESHPSNPSK
jgi:hypothetical protein